MRARALGAISVQIGRPYLYGFGAIGTEGVRRVLDIFQKEMDLTMALCGVTSVSQIGRENVAFPTDWLM